MNSVPFGIFGGNRMLFNGMENPPQIRSAGDCFI